MLLLLLSLLESDEEAELFGVLDAAVFEFEELELEALPRLAAVDPLLRLRVVVDFFVPVFAVVPPLLRVAVVFFAVDDFADAARLLVVDLAFVAPVPDLPLLDLDDAVRFLAVLFVLAGAALSALAAASLAADSAFEAVVLALALAALAVWLVLRLACVLRFLAWVACVLASALVCTAASWVSCSLPSRLRRISSLIFERVLSRIAMLSRALFMIRSIVS